MSAFDDVRIQLRAARDEAHAAARELFRRRERLERLRRQRRQAERGARPATGAAGSPELLALDRRIASLGAEIDEQRAGLAALRAAEARQVGLFADFTDPRREIGRFAAGTPILLLPLRIETRFKRAAEFGGESDELWVRVYPDDVSVDVFEDTLSENEVERAGAFWADVWRAGGDEAGERAAWRALVAGQGSGRSHWVIDQYRPSNEAERPGKAAGVPTVILTVVTRVPLAEPERSAVAELWRAVWRAGDDAAAQQAAFDALGAAVGADRAAELAAAYVPRNLADPPPAAATRDTTVVVVAFLDFPADDAVPTRQAGWTQAPHVATLPDRLVLLGYNGGELELERLGRPIPSRLDVAPDPSAEADEQIRPDGDDLQVGAEMEWVTDFERAVEVGMAFRVPLSALDFRRGFDTLMVLGVRLRSDADEGCRELEELFDHHHRSKGGFSILPQGRPTNNVEGESSGYSWQEESDTSFDHYFGTPPPDPDGWFARCDGRWLAELLGLDPAALAAVPFYGRADLAEARAMNVALWPATLGYWMDSLLEPVFDDATVRRTRRFFTRHVTARGQLPAIRVGKQPYGILPATPRSRIEWWSPRRDPIDSTVTGTTDEPERRFLARLYTLLRQVEGDFEPLLERVSFVGKPGADAHQVLLDVLGLHPGSVEHQQRYAESFAHLYNRMSLLGSGGGLLAILIQLGYVSSGMNLLRGLGYTPAEGAETPDLLEKLFIGQANQLKGPLVDDRPLSESDPIRAYTEGGDDYLTWLIDAAGTSHDALRLQQGFADGPPRALLYLMLRHALDLSFVEVSIRLFANAGLIAPAEVAAARREPKFIQVRQASLADPAEAGGSRWRYLLRRDAVVTGNPERTVGEFIPTVIDSMVATRYLKRQLAALRRLQGRPTAVLERVFAEHLDLCTYRLDAWYGGLLSRRLEELRYGGAEDGEGENGVGVDAGGNPVVDADGNVIVIDDDVDRQPAAGGLHLGAYGWLENVQPEHKQLTPVELPAELAEVFEPQADPPLVRDSTNQGFIHAPSLNHAVTAAVLRNGYLSNATPDNPGSLAVNLSSERVRAALSLIEGMKAHQSLGALLGYRFERALHDRHDVEVDELIYDLRKAFPLVGDRLRPTRTGRRDTLGRRLGIRRVEARNVIDGLALVEHLKESGNAAYPFGLDEDLPDASPAQAAAVSQEAGRLADLADAVADLAMAESVHQVVQGNYERAGAVLDTYSKGKFPSTPDVARTPRSGVTLTHRVALHLAVGLDPTDPARISPRARCEPALDAWLATVLPSSAAVACRVTVTDPTSGTSAEHTVTQADLELAPIDLLYLLDPDDEAAGRSLDDRIEAHVVATHAPRPHEEIAISYLDRLPAVAGHVPFFELAALLRELRGLLVGARPLRATDMATSGEASEGSDDEATVAAQRVTLPRDELAAHLADLETFRDALQARLDAEEHAQIASEIDQTVADFVALMAALAPFAELDTGTGAVFADRRRIFSALLDLLTATVERWGGRLADFDQAIADYDAGPGADPGADDEVKFRALQLAERLISTVWTDPLPAQPDDFRDDLVGTQRPAFVARRDALVALGDGAASVSALHDGIEASKPANADFDATEIDLSAARTQIVVLAEDLAHRAGVLAGDVAARLDAVQGRLDAHDAATGGRDRTAALTRAAKLLFGEDFVLVPDFSLPAAQGAEWGNAWGPGPAADRALLGYLENDLGRAFPVDDWMTGVARVRERLHRLEATTHLAEAFGGGVPELQPIQLPHRPDTPWLGLDFPAETPGGDPFVLDEDKLLYTACWAEPFDAARRQAGLLLDEWTEVIPSRSEDTGLAFHFDRPNSEPPQTLLLALSPRLGGGWRWEDLVDTVHETMDLAKKRAIEPDHLDTTAYARLLPALVSAVTLLPITASLNLSFNNDLAAALTAADGGDDG